MIRRTLIAMEKPTEIGCLMLDGLNQLRKDGTLCDITLRVGEKMIRVHRNVICACSPYIDVYLREVENEDNEGGIVIKDVDPYYLEMLIEFMYTGTLNFNATNVKDVLLAAAKLKITSAVELCCSYLSTNLVMDNCIDYILFSAEHSIESLLANSIEMAVADLHNIFTKNDYLEIRGEEFIKLIDEVKGTTAYTEDLILIFVMRWINHSPNGRMKFAEKLLQMIDYDLISPEVLSSLKIANTFNPTFTDWVTRNNARHRMNVFNNYILVSRRLGKFHPMRIKLLSREKHRTIRAFPYKSTDGSCVCNGYYIYHLGGWRKNKKLMTETFSFHPEKDLWVPFIPLLQARAYHRSCVLNGKIYSVGGSDGDRAFPSVEYTDLYTGQRSFTVHPLPRPKERPGLGVHENSMYVVGGSDRGTDFKCIHRYDEREGVWQELAPSPYRAGASSCAIVGEYIYTTHYDSLQRYDLRTNKWTLIFGQYNRYPQEVFCLDNTLFGLFSAHIAKYLPDLGKWQNVRAFKFHHPHLHVSTNLSFARNSYQFEDTDSSSE